jgi:hypothetical protein
MVIGVYHHFQIILGGRHGRDRMVVGFITTCTLHKYHKTVWGLGGQMVKHVDFSSQA